MKKHNRTSAKTLPKDTKLAIECTLIGGLLPMMCIYYQNRKISAFFGRELWNNHQAIEQLAKEIIEYRHTIKTPLTNERNKL